MREAQVGQVAVVGRGVGQALDVADGVVAGVADRPAAEAGQAGHGDGAVLPEQLLQGGQRVRCAGLGPLPLTGLAQAHALAKRFEHQDWPGPQKAVSPDLLAAHHRLEQKRPLALLDFAKRTDRGERVADEAAIHRH
jgi:hypothetical protein